MGNTGKQPFLPYQHPLPYDFSASPKRWTPPILESGLILPLGFANTIIHSGSDVPVLRLGLSTLCTFSPFLCHENVSKGACGRSSRDRSYQPRPPQDSQPPDDLQLATDAWMNSFNIRKKHPGEPS